MKRSWWETDSGGGVVFRRVVGQTSRGEETMTCKRPALACEGEKNMTHRNRKR